MIRTKYIKQTNEEMVTNIKNGDYKTVLQGLIPLIKREVGAKWYWHQNYDDIMQEAMLGCYNAITKFDIKHDSGANVNSYCIVAAHRRVQTYLNYKNDIIKNPSGETYKKLSEEQKELLPKAHGCDDIKLYQNNGDIEQITFNNDEHTTTMDLLFETLFASKHFSNKLKEGNRITWYIDYYYRDDERIINKYKNHLSKEDKVTLDSIGNYYGVTKQFVHNSIVKITKKIQQTPELAQAVKKVLLREY